MQKDPIFLQNSPSGKDEFKGQSHEKLSSKIVDLIKNDKLKTKVIGLEGDWGSGKSNIVKLVEGKLKNEYYTFIFDAWGNQEDLTRKTFLEQLIDELFENELLTDRTKWQKKEKQLLSKVSKKSTEKFPIVKPYVILFTISFIALSLFSGFYDNVLKNWDLSKGYTFGIVKPLISIYLIPLFFFIVGLISFKKELCGLIDENSKRSKKNKESLVKIFGKMFYWFNGNELTSEEIENVLEEDPSVLKFRRYFKEIKADLKKGTKLLVVFDNLDRLEEEKVKSLWSSIHTFFAEVKKDSKQDLDTWVIIPYNKKELDTQFNEKSKGFIEKTFSVNFTVKPPVVSEWEEFLEKKLIEAFGEDKIPKDEVVYIKKVFDLLVPSTTIKPRQIINYVNGLVSLYYQWDNEVEKGKIKYRYLAVYNLTKDEISINPTSKILGREYLKDGAENLFKEDKEIDTIMSSLSFGVPLKMADELLLSRELDLVLRNGDLDKLNDYMKHRSFSHYFSKSFNRCDLKAKINNLPEILKKLNGVLTLDELSNFWNRFADEIMFGGKKHFTTFSDTHKVVIENIEKEKRTKLMEHFFFDIRSDSKSDKNEQKNYYQNLVKFDNYISKNKIDIDFPEKSLKKEINVDVFYEFVEENLIDYEKFNFFTNIANILSFFHKDSTVIYPLIEKYQSSLGVLSKKHNYSELKELIKSNLRNLAYSDSQNRKRAIEILRLIEGQRPLNLKLNNNVYANFTLNNLKQEIIDIDTVCIGISDFPTGSNYHNFLNTINHLDQENLKLITNKIQIYLSYEDLLNTLLRTRAKSINNLKQIARSITKNKKVSVIDLKWGLMNYKSVIDLLGFDYSEAFIEKLDTINSEYEESYFEAIDIGVFNFSYRTDLGLIEKINNNATLFYKNLSKTEILGLFKSRSSKDFERLNSLVVSKSIHSFSNEFFSAYDDFIKQVASNDIPIPQNTLFWDKLIDLLNRSKLKSYFTSLRDYISEHDQLNEKELAFFSKGLLKHGNIIEKTEEMALKLILPMIKSKYCYENIFLENLDITIPLIEKSQEHKDAIVNELSIINKEKPIENKRLLKMITPQTTPLKTKKPSKSND